MQTCQSQRIKAFSLVELQITMVILTTGLLGLTAVLRTHSRQMESVESWYQNGMTYYLVSQVSPWMRCLEAPAQIYTEPGLSAWTPPVSGESIYRPQIESLEKDMDSREISMLVELEEIEE